MALCFSPVPIFLIFAPAIMDKTNASGLIPLRPFMTSLSLCGLTDKTTTCASWTDAALSVVTLIPCFLFNSAPRSSRGTEAIMFSGLASFLLSSPAIMASAITPGPINAIFFLSMISSKYWDRFRVPTICQFECFIGSHVQLFLEFFGILIFHNGLRKFIFIHESGEVGHISNNIQLMIFETDHVIFKFQR